ncbi:UNVERIFIED_CONTAM: hypothetical protein Slati_2255900 [Sesamum latifolium]|uniref:Uncharacterized protein n=1 Tax=Sesamum latifolium TaxID=2727402 RepID=A0AAW2WTY5_9LAMI
MFQPPFLVVRRSLFVLVVFYPVLTLTPELVLGLPRVPGITTFLLLHIPVVLQHLPATRTVQGFPGC